MATKTQNARLVKEIAKKYGKMIDLERSPSVIVEILREFGHLFSPGGDVAMEGGMGPGTGVSSIAGSGPPQAGEVESAVVLRAVLALQKDVKSLSRKLDRLSPGK
jgi:hypothetical protein